MAINIRTFTVILAALGFELGVRWVSDKDKSIPRPGTEGHE